MLTPAEVAETLRVSPSTVRRHVRDGSLAAVRPGPGPSAHIRVEPGALEDFLQGVARGEVRSRERSA